jgi:hypothetical protein
LAPKSVVSSQGYSATELLEGWEKAPDKLIMIHQEPIGFKMELRSYCRTLNYEEKDGRIFVKKSVFNNYTSKIFSKRMFKSA